VKWSQRFRATGSAAAGKMGGMRPKLLVGQHHGWLLDRIVRADFTLRGLVAGLAERGVKVDDRTVWSFVHAERLSFKKNRRSQRRTARWTRIGQATSSSWIISAATRAEPFVPRSGLQAQGYSSCRPIAPIDPIEQILAKLKHLLRKACERHASATCSTPSPKTNAVVISLMQDTLYQIIPL
jgi:hypothetical protein